jgi:hypothetical protein
MATEQEPWQALKTRATFAFKAALPLPLLAGAGCGACPSLPRAVQSRRPLPSAGAGAAGLGEKEEEERVVALIGDGRWRCHGRGGECGGMPVQSWRVAPLGEGARNVPAVAAAHKHDDATPTHVALLGGRACLLLGLTPAIYLRQCTFRCNLH